MIDGVRVHEHEERRKETERVIGKRHGDGEEIGRTEAELHLKHFHYAVTGKHRAQSDDGVFGCGKYLIERDFGVEKIEADADDCGGGKADEKPEHIGRKVGKQRYACGEEGDFKSFAENKKDNQEEK